MEAIDFAVYSLQQRMVMHATNGHGHKEFLARTTNMGGWEKKPTEKGNYDIL